MQLASNGSMQSKGFGNENTGFAASLRAASFNRKLIKQAVTLLRVAPGVEDDLADFREFEMPMYDGDLEARECHCRATMPADLLALVMAER